MSLSALPAVVIDEDGIARFNGLTAAERLAELDAPVHCTISQGDRTAAGIRRAGRREGGWRFAVDDNQPFTVEFVDGAPVDAPAGWRDAEWPGPSLDEHCGERAVLELILREYRSPDDVARIYELLVPAVGNSITVVRGLIQALGVSLTTAKMALDDACERSRR